MRSNRVVRINILKSPITASNLAVLFLFDHSIRPLSLIWWPLNGLTPCGSHHLVNSKPVSKSKQHGELTVIFSQPTINSFSKTKLTPDDSKGVFDFCSDTRFDIFRLDGLFIFSRVLFKDSYFACPSFRKNSCNQPVCFDAF